MKKNFFAMALYLAALFLPQHLVMGQTINEKPLQELLQTETVYSQERRETQITIGSHFCTRAEGKLFQTPVAFEYGLIDNWEISLEWEARSQLSNATTKTGGAGDLRIGTKYSWMNIGGSNLHMAAGFELGVPSGNVEKGLSEGKVEYEPYVVVAKDFPRLSRLQVFTQVGLALSRSEANVAGDKAVDKTIEWNNGLFIVHRQARFTTEVNWSKSDTENSVYLTPGIIWKLPRDLEFGVGLPIGLSRDADRFRSIVKIVYEFGGAKRSAEGHK